MSTSPATAPQGGSPANRTTVIILAAGTVLGVGLLIASLVGLFRSTDTVLGGLEIWRKNWWVVGLILLGQLGGLAVLFAVLQMLRGQERDNPNLRRVIYGFNAVLTGLLLVEVLVLINFLVYVPTKPFTAVNK